MPKRKRERDRQTSDDEERKRRGEKRTGSGGGSEGPDKMRGGDQRKNIRLRVAGEKGEKGLVRVTPHLTGVRWTLQEAQVAVFPSGEKTRVPSERDRVQGEEIRI